MSRSRLQFEWPAWLRGEGLEAGGSRGRAQAGLAAALLVSAGVYCLLWEAPGWMQLVLIGAAAVSLLGRSAAPIAVILIWVWGATLLPELGRLFALDFLRFSDFVSAVVLLAIVIFALRYLELQGSSGKRTLTRSVSEGGANENHIAPNPRRSRDEPAESPSASLRPFAGLAWRAAMAPLAALVLLWLIPLETMWPNTARIMPSAYRTIAFFWLLTILAIVSATGFSLLRWRKLTPGQATVYLHQTLIDEARGEHASLERRRARLLRNQENK